MVVRRTTVAALASSALCLLIASPLAGQDPTASVTGAVRDATGAPVEGAAITARSTARGLDYRTVAGVGGAYWLEGLPAGTYHISAMRIGFATATREAALLRVGTTVTLDFTLREEAVELETLRVEEPLLATTRADVSFTVDRELAQSLPDASRQMTQIALLAPGTTTTSNGPPEPVSAVAVGGLNPRSTSVLVDGGSINEPQSNFVDNGLPRLAVDEVQVLTTSYTAEFGQAASGTINATTRRGTNELSAEGFVLYRDRALSASEAIAVGNPDFSRTSFGFALGGPVRRDRTHYFVAVEGTDALQAGIINTGGIYPQYDGEYDLPRDEQLVLARLDHRLNEAHDVTVRYTGGTQSRRIGIGPTWLCTIFGGPSLASPRFGIDEASSVKSILMRHRWSVGRRSVNQATFQLYRRTNTWDRLSDDPTLEYPTLCDGGNFYDQDEEMTRLEVKNAFSFGLSGSTGGHRIKLGGRLSVGHAEGEHRTFSNGRFFGFNEDRSTDPSVFLQPQDPITIDETNTQIGLFVQDEWRPIPNLTLNLGVRYDIETNGMKEDFVGSEAEDLPFVSSAPRPIDSNNVAPRIAFAWDAGGDARTVVRGGFGVFYDQLWLWRSHSAEGGDVEFVAEPGTLNPDSIDGPVVRVVFPFDSVMPTPSTRQISLGIEQLLPGRIVLSLDGVLVRGRNLPLTVDRNPMFEYPQYAMIWQYQNSGRAETSMLMLQAQRQADTWSVNLAYTLADRKTTVDLWSVVIPVADTVDNFASEFGPTDWDERHRLVLSGWTRLPAGLQAGLRLIYASARPYSVFDETGARVGKRNNERGPDFFTTDLTLGWPIPVGSAEVGLTLNVYNLLNRTNYDPASVNESMSSPLFGEPQAAFPRRRLELGIQAWF